MSTEDNKALVRRFYAEIDNGNIGIIDELVDENYIDHNPPPFGLPPGREGVKEIIGVYLEAFNPLTVQVLALASALGLCCSYLARRGAPAAGTSAHTDRS